VPIQRPNAHAAWRSVTSDSAVRVASRVSEMSLTLVESTRFRTARISYAPLTSAEPRQCVINYLVRRNPTDSGGLWAIVEGLRD
jgi:hypothetical protein